MIPLKDHNPTHRRPVVTLLLLAVNIGVFFLLQPQDTSTRAGAIESIRFNYEFAAVPCEIIEGRPLSIAEIEATVSTGQDLCLSDEELARVPAGRREAPYPGKRVWVAMVTSMFLHGGLLHLGGNMLFLWIFGNNIEDHLGHVRYILFYLAGGVVATLAHVAVAPDSSVPLVGASGAIAAVMGAYLAWFPRARIHTIIVFFLITFVEIEARWLLGFWLLSQFFIGNESGVAWMAHVGGFVFGFGIGMLVRSSRAALRATWARDWDDPFRPTPPPGRLRRRY
ncbi:MAG TPA: rhomboid family intramembrane serine protease [Acidimicrobiales bacterium]